MREKCLSKLNQQSVQTSLVIGSLKPGLQEPKSPTIVKERRLHIGKVWSNHPEVSMV